MLRPLHHLLLRFPVTRGIQRRLLYRIRSLVGCPSAYEDLARVIRAAQPDAILDIGAYVGDTIARFLEDHEIPIHGFEPTPDSFRRLQHRFAGNRLVHLHQLAFSDRNGTIKMHCNCNAQTNSLLDNAEGNRTAFPEHTRHVGTMDVPTMRLDTWVEEHLPDARLVIKSDVQGAEGLLLDGGAATFGKQVIALLSEAQLRPMYEQQADFFALNRRLSQLGFAVRNIYPCAHDALGRAVQTDVLWVHEDWFPPRLAGVTP